MHAGVRAASAGGVVENRLPFTDDQRLAGTTIAAAGTADDGAAGTENARPSCGGRPAATDDDDNAEDATAAAVATAYGCVGVRPVASVASSPVVMNCWANGASAAAASAVAMAMCGG